MGKRSSLRFTLFLLLSDIILTNFALYEARQLRMTLDLGKIVGPEGQWLDFDAILFSASAIKAVPMPRR